MTYHQKAIVCTTDEKGQGKVVYWEDDNGKISKKTKKFNSQDEMEKVYEEFGLNEPMVEAEEFLDFKIPSSFNLLSDFTDSFFGRSPLPMLEEPREGVIPKDVNINKHRERFRALQEKKRSEELEKQKIEEDKRYLQKHLEELKNIHKELKEADDKEGAKAVEEDIGKIEKKLKSM